VIWAKFRSYGELLVGLVETVALLLNRFNQAHKKPKPLLHENERQNP
jgi:hypothetical protein